MDSTTGSAGGNDKTANILYDFQNSVSSYCTIEWYFMTTKTNLWWLQIFNGVGFCEHGEIAWEASLTFIVGIPRYVYVLARESVFLQNIERPYTKL
jgi:hypothetical protein